MTDTQAAGSASPVRRDLNRRVMGLSSVIVTLLAAMIGAIVTATGVALDGGSETVLVALGTGLIAAAAYSTIQAYFLNLDQRTFLADGLQSDLEEPLRAAAADGAGAAVRSTVEADVVPALRSAIALESQKVAHSVNEDIPSASYEPSEDPNATLNSAIGHALRTSLHYTFVGVSGTFTAVRLQDLVDSGHWRLNDVVLVLADPRQVDALDLRIAQEQKRPESLEETQQDIYATLVALALLRKRLKNIQVYWGIPPLNRHEIFDTTAFTTLFGDEGHSAFRFPRAIQCDSTSSWYRTFAKEASYLAKRGEPVSFPIGVEDADLAAWLSGLVGRVIRIDEVARFRARFEEKRARIADGGTGSLATSLDQGRGD